VNEIMRLPMLSQSSHAFIYYRMLIVSRQIGPCEIVGGPARQGTRVRAYSVSRGRRSRPRLTRPCARSVTFAVSTTLMHVFQ